MRTTAVATSIPARPFFPLSLPRALHACHLGVHMRVHAKHGNASDLPLSLPSASACVRVCAAVVMRSRSLKP